MVTVDLATLEQIDMEPLYFYKGHLYHIVAQNAKFKSVTTRKWHKAIGYQRADSDAENKDEVFYREETEFFKLFQPVEIKGILK